MFTPIHTVCNAILRCYTSYSAIILKHNSNSRLITTYYLVIQNCFVLEKLCIHFYDKLFDIIVFSKIPLQCLIFFIGKAAESLRKRGNIRIPMRCPTRNKYYRPALQYAANNIKSL